MRTVAGSDYIPPASHGSPGLLRNAFRLLAMLVRHEEAEGEKELSSSMREWINGLLGLDESAQCFGAVYNLPKKE
jgi:hypothetical protein